jgi:hypothetical protein
LYAVFFLSELPIRLYSVIWKRILKTSLKSTRSLLDILMILMPKPVNSTNSINFLNFKFILVRSWIILNALKKSISSAVPNWFSKSWTLIARYRPDGINNRPIRLITKSYFTAKYMSEDNWTIEIGRDTIKIKTIHMLKLYVHTIEIYQRCVICTRNRNRTYLICLHARINTNSCTRTGVCNSNNDFKLVRTTAFTCPRFCET